MRGQNEWHTFPIEAFLSVKGMPGVRIHPNLEHFDAHRNLWSFLKYECLIIPSAASHTIRRAIFDKETVELGWTLRPYQHNARDFLQPRSGALLADQMRLGKTPTILASAQLPFAVCAPLSTRHVWLSWFKRRWPDIVPTVLTGQTLDSSRLKNAQLVFLHYDLLPYWQTNGYLDLATLAFDECHRLSNYRTRQYDAAQLLAAQADQVWGATGTPLWNKPQNMFAILNLLTPGAWGDYKKFTARYMGGHPGAYGWVCDGPSHEEEFKIRLQEVMLRRTWEDVLDQVPKMVRDIEIVDVSLDQQIQLEKLAAAKQLHNVNSTTIGELARLRQFLGLLKVNTTVTEALNVVCNDEPVIVWCWHKGVAINVCSRLQDSFKPVFLITGDTKDRDVVLDNWRAVKNGALVITLGVGQAGIDLSHSRQQIYCEVDWTPAVMSQSEMRPFSPNRPTITTYIVADHPLDRKVIAVLIKKCYNAERMGTPAAETAIDVLKAALDMENDVDLWDIFEGGNGDE